MGKSNLKLDAETIDFINSCLEISNKNNILLEVICTLLVSIETKTDIEKELQESLWYWLKFTAQKEHKVDLQKLKTTLNQIVNEHSK